MVLGSRWSTNKWGTDRHGIEFKIGSKWFKHDSVPCQAILNVHHLTYCRTATQNCSKKKREKEYARWNHVHVYQQKYSRSHPTKIHMKKKNNLIIVLVARRPFYGWKQCIHLDLGLLVYFDFCSMFPRSSSVTQYPTLHRAVCAFRSLFAQVLECGGCKVITAPNCTHFNPLGLGKVAGFFGSFCLRSKAACWFGVFTHALEGSASHKIPL